MAVTTTNSRKQYTQGPGGTTTDWPVDFKFLDNEDLVVVTTVGAVDTTLELDTDYSVTGAGLDAGGTVTIDPPIAAGTRLTIYRETDLDQPTVLPSSGGWFPKVHEAVFDRIVMQIQQLYDAVERSVRVLPSDITDPALYLTEVRAAVASTTADAVSTGEDAVATAADRVQTGLDAVATAADRVQTGLDRTATGEDRVQTGLDAAATAQDAIDTAADRVQTGLDAIATAGDRVQTGLDAAAAAQDADDADGARIAAEAAQAAAEAAAANVSVNKYEATASAGQTVITPGFTFSDIAGNVVVYIDGLKQALSTYTLTSPTITLSEALAGGETIEVYSVEFEAGPSTPLYATDIGSTVQAYDADTLIADASKVRTKAHPCTKSAVTANNLTPDLTAAETFDWTPTGAATLNAPTIPGSGVWAIRYNYSSGPTLPKATYDGSAWAATGDILLIIGFGSADYELLWLNKA